MCRLEQQETAPIAGSVCICPGVGSSVAAMCCMDCGATRCEHFKHTGTWRVTHALHYTKTELPQARSIIVFGQLSPLKKILAVVGPLLAASHLQSHAAHGR